MVKIKKENKLRLITACGFIGAMLVIMVLRLAWIQVVRADEYRDIAIDQQTQDIPVEPERGAIYDRNGQKLAASATCYNVWVRPADMDGYTDSQIDDIGEKLSLILDMDKKEVMKDLKSKSRLVKMAEYIDIDTANKVRNIKIGKNEEPVTAFECAEVTKRYYPMGSFASTLLGSVNDEGVGRSGIELQYDEYLSGVAGRWVKDTDINGNTLSYGEKKYYSPEDGLNVVLTIDEVMQHYLESAMEDAYKKIDPDKIWAVAMDPKTGDILSMATYPGFDPNNPGKAVGSSYQLEKYKEMSDEDKGKYINSMWRNPLVSDVYEPGSTFKLLTASSILEEGLATPETTYECAGSIDVNGVSLHCWDKPHGTLTLSDAVAQSCNPAHVQMALELGKDKFYEYLNLFGITETTGIDLPAEGQALIQDKDAIGNVELATMGFGQGIAVTPLQMITAISAIGNDGVLMQPRVVKELTDSKGKTVKKFKTEKVKKVLSEKTTEEMKKIMELEVLEGSGKTAIIPGYRIGGKTGTANKPSEDGGYGDELLTSFICLAPIDNPQIAVLVVVENARKAEYGSTAAAPVVKSFLEKTLPYMNISPVFTDEEKAGNSTKYQYVPDITGKTYSEACNILAASGLKYEVRPALEDGEDTSFVVVDQYPKAGKKVNQSEKVFIYRE